MRIWYLSDAKAHTLAEPVRVLKPGGELIVVDFAKPYRRNPFRYLWRTFLAIFEPFALAMWWNDVGQRGRVCVAARRQRGRMIYAGFIFSLGGGDGTRPEDDQSNKGVD